MTDLWHRAILVPCALLLIVGRLQSADTHDSKSPAPRIFSAASFNLANWGRSDRWAEGKYLKDADKPDSERRAVMAILGRLRPDILAVQEIIRDRGDRHLEDFKGALEKAGLRYPAAFAITGLDQRIQIALFSRFPMRERRALNEDHYEITGTMGKDAPEPGRIRRRVERGFIHAIIEIAPRYAIEVFVAHLKSKRDFPEFDGPEGTGQEIIRRHEAEILRRHVDARLRLNPAANILILGDLNDTLGSPALQILSGRRSDPVRMYPLWLSDDLRDAWTHLHRPERQYSLFDHAIASQGLFNEYSPSHSFVYREPAGSPAELRWDSASDHRPIVAGFYTADLTYSEKQRIEPAAQQ